MKLAGVRVKRVMRGEDAAAWARAIADPSWVANARVLKDEPGSSWVRRATINGRDLVLKCRLLNTPSRRFKSALGHGHGDKHWHGAALLAAKKIPTARPVVLITARVDEATAELLLLEYLEGSSLLEVLDRIRRGRGPRVREQHRIAAAAGRSAGMLLKAGLCNRDHKPSNLVVSHGANGAPAIAVIDVVGLRRCRFPDDGEQMLASMMIEPTGVGCPPRRSLWIRAIRGWIESGEQRADRAARHAKLRAVIRRIETLIESHGDPRPRTDPLPRDRDAAV